MQVGDGQHQLFVVQRAADDLLVLERQKHHAEIELIGEQAGPGFLGSQFEHRQLDAGMLAMERDQLIFQQVVAGATNAEVAPLHAADLADFQFGLLHFVNDPAGMFQQDGSGLGQIVLFADTADQGGSELLFQQANLVA
ncbi:hypothetical protein D3C76_1389140 [compost metagenome]